MQVRKTPVAYTVGPPGALSAIFHLEAPARARAFADEQRVVAGDEGRRVRTRNARPAPRWRGSATVGLTMWLPYLRPNTCPLSSRRGRDSAHSTPAWASPPSVVTRPRVAARSPISGAPLAATKGGRETVVQSPRALRLRRLPCRPARVASDVAPLTNRPGRTLKFGVMPGISLPSHLPITRAFAVLTLLLVLRSSAEPQAPLQPDIRIYKRIGTTTLKAYIFMPGGPVNATPRAAIVLLHGGGWSTGSPEWMHDDAKRYAGLGMVAIAGEYRLSDQESVTPLDAMADVRDLIRWVRTKATELFVNPHRIAAYGVSAGGHLALSAAVFPHTEEDRTSAVPDMLILISPPVSLLNDKWPQLLLGKRTEAKTVSPAENVTQRLPPIVIIEGAADTVTPPLATQRFCDRAKQLGGSCELNLYPKLGHILSRNLDPRAQEEGRSIRIRTRSGTLTRRRRRF